MDILKMEPIGEAVSYAAALEYEKNIPQMLEKINEIMEAHNQSENLIGDNPVSVMHTNHHNHANFMVNVFKLNDYELLKNTVKWVLDSYEARGFKEAYFPRILDAWIKVVNETLRPGHAQEIVRIYEWNRLMLPEIEESIKNEKSIPFPFDADWEDLKNRFTKTLLEGNAAKALELSKTIVHDAQSLKNFYVKVLTYSMYEIGAYWEKGIISVSQEHLATSIVMRIIASLYMNFILVDYTKGKAIVTASQNEYHEVGARTVADFLELDGWDVTYLGANIPNESLIKLIKQIRPVFLCISVTMTFNLERVKEVISLIRSDAQIAHLKIMAGGYAFSFGMNSKERIGADYIGLSIDDSVITAKKWWDEKNGK